MDIKEIKSQTVIQRLQESAWPCGDLRTGTIAIGLTCLVSSALITFYFIEDYLSFNKFHLVVVGVGVVTLFRVLSDIALLYGAVTKTSALLVPWLVLQAALQIFIILFMSFKYGELVGRRGIILISFAIVCYFILVVFLFYKQLTAPKDTTSQPQQMVDLENLQPAVTDETFTEIASRDATAASAAVAACLDDSGEFTMPASATESKTFSFPLNDSFAKPLPTPDEVIEVQKSANNPFLADLDRDEVDEATQSLLPAPKRPISTSRNDLVDMNLVDNFTPFKAKKSANSQENLPKMKVFLPKTDSQDEDCSSNSSTD